MKSQAHALHELLQFRALELVLQLGLPGKDDPQHFFLVRFDSG